MQLRRKHRAVKSKAVVLRELFKRHGVAELPAKSFGFFDLISDLISVKETGHESE
jgi:hypothetical protein